MGYIRKSSKVYSEPSYGGRANRKQVDTLHNPSSMRFGQKGDVRDEQEITTGPALMRPPRPTGAGKIKVWLDQRWN